MKLRRPQERTLYRLWEGPLRSGFDFFDELPALGVKVDGNGRPDREAAREAWQQFGTRIVAERDPKMLPCWAETEFGAPGRGE